MQKPLVAVVMGSSSDWDTMKYVVEALERFGVEHERHVVSGLQGLDSLLSIVQMPAGVPVGTLAIGKAGATNAGLLAVSILATSRPKLRTKLHKFRKEQTAKVRKDRLP